MFIAERKPVAVIKHLSAARARREVNAKMMPTIVDLQIFLNLWKDNERLLEVRGESEETSGCMAWE
jgi:hypothetical protein